MKSATSRIERIASRRGGFGSGGLRFLLLAALAYLSAPSTPASANTKEDNERAARVKLQVSYIQEVGQNLLLESLFRLCNQEAAADEVAPERMQRAKAAAKASQEYIAAGGGDLTWERMEKISNYLDATETAWDAGFRLGVLKALEFANLSNEDFCSKWMSALKASLDESDPEAPTDE